MHVLTFHPPRSIVNDNGVFKFLFEEYHGLIELARILTEEFVQLEEEVRYDIYDTIESAQCSMIPCHDIDEQINKLSSVKNIEATLICLSLHRISYSFVS